MKSSAESLMESIKDYSDVEFICLDDNSKEEGTKEYLDSLKDRGWRILHHEDYRTSPKGDVELMAEDRIKAGAGGSSPGVTEILSDALNILLNEATGDLFAPIHGDEQFVRKNWLNEYVSLFRERDDVFCVGFDAQRRVRLEGCTYKKVQTSCGATFAIESGRRISGAGEVLYDRKLLLEMGGWNYSENVNSEDLFTYAAHAKYDSSKKCYVPWIPPAIAIYTDPRGTQARVRGNKRFGIYWEAKNNMYYNWVEPEKVKTHDHRPCSIEEMASSYKNQWKLPIDEIGNWKKNPINWPHEQADYEIIY